MIVVDAAGHIRIVNGEAERMFGYGREQMLGQPIELLLPERHRMRHEQHRADYGKTPRVRAMGAGMELTGLRQDGGEFPVEVSLSPIHTGSGMLVVSAIRDVTERRLIAQELERARQVAERANKANTAFLSAASHDLRQPVQALALLTGALKRTVTDPLALEMIQSQQESLESMTSLLNSLLDISRLDAGAFEPRLESFPIENLLNRLTTEFSRQARHKGLTFEAVPCEVLVRSDPDLLGEIIQNFVSNAIRYTDEGGVRLCCERDGDEVVISVRDTGIGIPAEQLDSIFREFHQVRRDDRKREGVGLGLAITRRLADLLQHPISVESTPGQGSCFSIRVPLASQATVPEQPASTQQAGAARSGLVILVEDDLAVAKAWGSLLSSVGYRVVSAASATEARLKAAELDGAPDLIISDFHLADGSNGIEAVTGVREQVGLCVPAFVVTGDTSRVVHEVEKLSDCRVLSKPVGPDTLLNLARAAIDRGT